MNTIGIDAFVLKNLSGGISFYLFCLLKQLIPMRPHWLFILYTTSPSGDFAELLQFSNVRIRSIRAFSSFHSLWIQTSLAIALYQDSPDFFWAPAQIMPLVIQKKIKTILTVHDFVYRISPQSISKSRYYLMHLFSGLFYRSADYIFCNSKGTANKLKLFYGIDSTDVVTPPLKDTITHKKGYECRDVLKKYGLHYKEFILTVGSIEPKKNLMQLMEFYEKLLIQKDLSSVIPLVIVGGYGWRNTQILDRIARMRQLYPDHFIPLGFVPDIDMPVLYSAARFFVLFSVYEGYGMPLMEARACHTPIACFDIEEMREAADNEGLFMDKKKIPSELAPLFDKKTQWPQSPKKYSYPTTQELAEKIARLLP
ncbi:MAG: glycosyltransferase family 1 protein [Chlamydiia bacterium]